MPSQNIKETTAAGCLPRKKKGNGGYTSMEKIKDNAKEEIHIYIFTEKMRVK